jgi:hypothetical protein
MKLFVASYILVAETAGDREGQPSRSLDRYVTSSLFLAKDADSAYETAIRWLPGFDDSTHNDSGELVHHHALGLLELEELHVEPEHLLRASNEIYGVDVGHLNISCLSNVESSRPKNELAAFARTAAQPINPADA